MNSTVIFENMRLKNQNDSISTKNLFQGPQLGSFL